MNHEIFSGPEDTGSRMNESAEILVGLSESGDAVVLSASEALARWIDVPLERLKGVPLSELAGEAVPGLLEAVRTAMEGGSPDELSMRFTSKEGLEHSVRIRVFRPEAYSARGVADVVVVRLERERTGRRGAEILPYSEFHGLVGQSPAMLSVYRKIESYGPADASVIITGETGTGKELAARALHMESRRRRGPFVAVNCTAISKELLESELFGHERGSFTGAVKTHRGRFERASGGSLFMDEVGDMPMSTQAKLLRVLQERKIERVGAEHPLDVDVRVISATNIPLEEAVGLGRFREDLYHRLSVLRIHLPPLRDRGRDLESLVSLFLEEFNRTYDRNVIRLTPGALELLYQYHWPGNVRELRNVIERVFIETRSDLIGAKALEEWVHERQSLAPGGWNMRALHERRAGEEPIIVPQQPFREMPLLPPPTTGEGGRAVARAASRPLRAEDLSEAYRSAGGNIAEASRILGIHKATFYRRMKEFGLGREDLEK